MANFQDDNKRQVRPEPARALAPVDRSDPQSEEIAAILVELWRQDIDQQRRLQLIRQAWERAAAEDPKMMPLLIIIGPPLIANLVAAQRQTAAIENLAAGMQESNTLRRDEIKAANRQGCLIFMATIIAPILPLAASLAFGLVLRHLGNLGATETVVIIIALFVLLYVFASTIAFLLVGRRRHNS